MPEPENRKHAMTKDEYDAYVAEHGETPTWPVLPGEHHRDERNKDIRRHSHHTRGTG